VLVQAKGMSVELVLGHLRVRSLNIPIVTLHPTSIPRDVDLRGWSGRSGWGGRLGPTKPPLHRAERVAASGQMQELARHPQKRPPEFSGTLTKHV